MIGIGEQGGALSNLLETVDDPPLKTWQVSSFFIIVIIMIFF
jgi:hypothetical protein